MDRSQKLRQGAQNHPQVRGPGQHRGAGRLRPYLLVALVAAVPKLGTDFAVPVFLVEGKNDLVASPAAAQRWFDSIKAPAKAIVVLPRAGHDPNQDVIDAEYKMLTEKILPLTR